MRFLKAFLWVAIVLFAFSFRAHAALADDTKPVLHPLFTDNMVLQRGIADPVWGWAAPGRAVAISIDGKPAVTTTAGADGKWMAKLTPMTAGGPFTLTITGPQTITLHNVMVGDVWLCSGQSNMQFGIGNSINGAQEIAAANYPDIRLFMTPSVIAPKPRETVSVNAIEGHWKICSPQTVGEGGWGGFTAAGYFFARDLQKQIHVPIGLIQSNWGGTVAEAWTSADALKTMPDFASTVENYQKAAERGISRESIITDWYAKYDAGSKRGLGWADPALNTVTWKSINLPGYFQDAGIPELAKTNGVVWFRRTFDLPAEDIGKDAILHLQADDNDVTWINGVSIGATDGYQAPRNYKIAASLLKATGNAIAVRVTDTGGEGGIWGDPAHLQLEVPGGSSVPLAGAWVCKLGTTGFMSNPGGDPNTVTVLYNGMIAPLTPFAIKGALWYQGEQNADRGKQYQTLLPVMIKDWRSHFGIGDFPFLIVQLAGFQPGGTNFARLREAQMVTAQTVPNTGIVTAIDIGNAHNVHPTNKQEVGRRLALLARSQVYGEAIESSGPVLNSMKIEGAALCLSFDHAAGLKAKDGMPLRSFEIAGEDGNFVPADAKIEGETVILSSPRIPHPTAARYAWAGFPDCSLYNAAGLPAFPFRTNPQN